MSDDNKSPVVPSEVVEQVEPLIRSLPEEKQVQLRQIIATSFQGPLPPPSMMAEYDQVIPNGADRLMSLVEKQTDHRIAMESALIRGRIVVTRTGQWLAASLSVFFGLVAAFMGYTGHDWLAGSISVTTITGLAVVFVLGKRPGAGSDDGEAPEDERAPPPKPKRRKR